MKKYLQLFLCIQLFCGNIFFAELLRLPSLLQHFQHHLQIHQDVSSFSDFIYLHYIEEPTDQKNTHSEDEHELPFKHDLHHCLHLYSATVALAPVNQVFSFLHPSPTLSFPSALTAKICGRYPIAIWQPPKQPC
jgi:hypothetical protein